MRRSTVSNSCTFLQCLLAFIAFVFLSFSEANEKDSEYDSSFMLPTVFIAILARNKAHTLPYFFAYLERLDYPANRIALWLRSDHNVDDTDNVLKTWLDVHRERYHSVEYVSEESPEKYADETGTFEWTESRYKHLIRLKEEALMTARKKWADYILFLDCDVFLVNNSTLKTLIQENKTIVAPLIETLGAYSNFWCGMTESGYYKRTDEYLPILERETIGCFDVPMVHSAVLVNLRHTKAQQLTFDPKKLVNYNGSHDDILLFAYSARTLGIKMYISNKEQFGYMLAPLEKEKTLQDDREQLLNLKVEILVDYPEVYISKPLQHFIRKREEDTLGFDQVYLINLERRPDRRKRMVNTLHEMGIHVHTLHAVDGKQLNDSYIEHMGIRMLPEYMDPFHKRILTKGEIGCFLSHYQIWKDMIDKQHRTAIVLEDDLRFEPYFRSKIQTLLKEVQKVGLLWDLIYLGRKRLSAEGEPFVAGTSNLVHVNYSYWTLCYLITLEGAKKLVAANPLPKLVPVDEYFPIMFDRHPESVWKGYFPKRNLRAFSAHPLLVYPTHYTGQENYVSDTEDSDIAPSVAKDEL